MKKLLLTLAIIMLGLIVLGQKAKAADLKIGECSVNAMKVDATISSREFRFYQTRGGENCYFPGSCLTNSDSINVSLNNIVFNGDSSFFTGKVKFFIYRKTGSNSQIKVDEKTVSVVNGSATASFSPVSSNKEEIYFTTVKYLESFGNAYQKMDWNCNIKTSGEFKTSNTCDEDSCKTTPVDADLAGPYNLCLQQVSSDQGSALERCIDCFSNNGIWTAIGCIPQTADGIISSIMQLGLVIAGAVVLIMILVGSFMLSTSQGDPKKTQEAKEMITSAIIGLLFVIFSITILQFIGVSIIKIPGFGE